MSKPRTKKPRTPAFDPTQFGLEPAVCESCQQPMLWGVNEATGARIPLNARPVVTFVPLGGGKLQTRRSFQSHFGTCRFATLHRKPRKGKEPEPATDKPLEEDLIT